MDIANLGAQLEQYEDKWIAIDESEEKIVGVADNAFEATAEAEQTAIKIRFFSKSHPLILPSSHLPVKIDT